MTTAFHAPATENKAAMAACLRAIAATDPDNLLEALDALDKALTNDDPAEVVLIHGGKRYRLMRRHAYALFRGNAGTAFCSEKLGVNMTAAAAVRRLRKELLTNG
jgi:hypothetical protein